MIEPKVSKATARNFGQARSMRVILLSMAPRTRREDHARRCLSGVGATAFTDVEMIGPRGTAAPSPDAGGRLREPADSVREERAQRSSGIAATEVALHLREAGAA